MRYKQASCARCGEMIERNAGRMRLHVTNDSSVRHTRMVASFHPECGEALVEELANQREVKASANHARPQWGRGPRALEAAAWA